jgi:hypothetical protein
MSELKDIHYYVARAFAETGSTSKTELCNKLHVTRGMVGHWLKHWHLDGAGSYPSEDVMVELARLGKEDPAEALCNLQIWKSGREPVKEVWEQLRDLLRRFGPTATLAFPLLIVTGLLAPQREAQAGAPIPNVMYSADRGAEISAAEGCILWKALGCVSAQLGACAVASLRLDFSGFGLWLLAARHGRT